MRPFLPLVLAWLGLLALLAVEVLAARGLGWANTAPFFGILMAGLVAVLFMHANEGPGVIRVFVFAGAFWMIIMMGLGTLDTLTRTDHPVDMRTPVEP